MTVEELCSALAHYPGSMPVVIARAGEPEAERISRVEPGEMDPEMGLLVDSDCDGPYTGQEVRAVVIFLPVQDEDEG